jgi:hypothetical protein
MLSQASKPPATPGDACQQAALGALIESGLSSVVSAAANAPIRERVSAAMMEMLPTNKPECYSWSAEKWIIKLGLMGINCSKQTIVGNRKNGIAPCDAWTEIMNWRASNKQKRAESVFEKTGEKLSLDKRRRKPVSNRLNERN